MCFVFCFFFFNDPATTEIYTLSLHDALPISWGVRARGIAHPQHPRAHLAPRARRHLDRKSTRLNSSHTVISYAVFCLKKKKKKKARHTIKHNIYKIKTQLIYIQQSHEMRANS